MTLKKMWDHKLQVPNHTHPTVGHKANSIRRTEAAVTKTVSRLKSCRKLHKFAMKKQKCSVDLCAVQEGKTPWPQEVVKNKILNS